jgi:hypothetical protein
MILEPPWPPIAKAIEFVPGFSTITGLMEDCGRFPARMKLFGDGSKPKKFVLPGMEKSFISLLSITPLSGSISLAPKAVLTVLVRETTSPQRSAETR